MASLFNLRKNSLLSRLLGRFARDRRGNVATIFAITAVPLLFAVGMGIDYANNARRWTQMNAAADAAALTAVTQQMMLQPDAVAVAAAKDMFLGQISGFSGLTFNPDTNLTINIADSGLNRTATVSYTAQGANVFSGILNSASMNLSGSSQASGTNPNMNFYLLLDTSPSMALPATPAGITKMVGATYKQWGGCAFACHESTPPVCSDPPLPANLPPNLPAYQQPNFDVCGNPQGSRGTPYYSMDGTDNTPATGIDDYQLARQLGITLRIDEVAPAAATMISTVVQTWTQNLALYGWSPTYGVAVDSFDVSVRSLFPLTDTIPGLENLASNVNPSSGPSPVQMLEVYDEDNLCSEPTCTQPPTYNNDTDTNIDLALTQINTPDPSNPTSLYIPTPGEGSNPPTPQAVLMIVTDGLEDECVASVTAGNDLSTINPPKYKKPALCDPYRQMAPIAAPGTLSAQLCAAIKQRGIKIGVLYLTYDPLPLTELNFATGQWQPSYYDQNVNQFQPGSLSGDQIAQDMMANCASNSNLFITVGVGDDISKGLKTLFNNALQDYAHLTQ